MVKKSTLLLISALGIQLLFISQVYAQQMVVDDATLTVHRSFQFESWIGSEESSVHPAVSATTWLDVAPGIISTADHGFSNWLIDFKAVPKKLNDNDWAFGLVAAPVFDMNSTLQEFYSYVPISHKIAGSRTLIHVNVGAEGVKNNTDSGWSWKFTKGLRADLRISDRITLLSELFGLNFETPFFQGGMRYSIVPGFLNMDLTYGQGFKKGIAYPGFSVGLSVTPKPLW